MIPVLFIKVNFYRIGSTEHDSWNKWRAKNKHTHVYMEICAHTCVYGNKCTDLDKWCAAISKIQTIIIKVKMYRIWATQNDWWNKQRW